MTTSRRFLLTFPTWVLMGSALICALATVAASAAEPPKAALADIASRYFADKMELDPLNASALLADPRYEGRLTVTIAPAEVARARALNERVKRELAAVDPAALSDSDRLTRELLAGEVQLALDGDAFPAHLMPIDHYGGVPLLLATLGSGEQLQPLKTPADYDHYLQRLQRLPDWNRQAIANMREGVKRGYTVPRALIESALPTFTKLGEPDFDKSDFSAALKIMPASFAPAERTRLAKAYRRVFAEQVQPAMAELLGFLQHEYLGACRTSSGAWALPNGAAYYAYLVRLHTTTDLSPDEIHALGLREVARIRGEIAKVQAAMKFDGSLTEFLRWHAQAPQFRPYRTSQEVVDAYTALNQRIAPQLAQWFGRTPKRPLLIRPVPELQVASGGSYYNAASPDGSRPGTFFVWVDDPRRVNSAQTSSLLLHEGQPGHHFQMSIQQELGLPDFRRYGWSTAFGEGWALYAETLGRELGLYDDPNQYLGHLKLELMRAVRLVTDTGLHAKGWTREQTIAYMMETEGSTESDARNATERYMALPAQALGYKIGSLKIQALRERAQAALRDKFSPRDFHDLVLSEGTVPLGVLERMVDAWIVRRKGA
ncbi:MAG TPA: DUF885 domain-containing protein [Burkholderiaceae bacterium]